METANQAPWRRKQRTGQGEAQGNDLDVALGLPGWVCPWGRAPTRRVGAAVKRRPRQHPWHELATRTGLAFTPSGCLGLYGWPSVRGLYRGRELVLYTAGDSLTESLSEDTKIRVEVHPAMYVAFSLSPPMWPPLARVYLPKGRVLVGDDQFDGAFLLRGEPEESVAAVFALAELRQRALGLHAGTRLMLSGMELWLQQPGLERDADYLHFAFDLLCDLAERVEETAAGHGTP